MDINDPFSAFGMGGIGGFHRPYKFPQGGLRQQEKKKDPPVVHELNLSLEEVFSGCTKKMKISRKRLSSDGCSLRTEDKILTVDIKRGWKEGTKITFPREGDQTPTNIPADVVFVVKDKPHPVFRREGSDIVYPAKITLREVSLSSLLKQEFGSSVADVFSSLSPGVMWLHDQSSHSGREDHHCNLQRSRQTWNEEANRRRGASAVQVSDQERGHDPGLQC